MFELTRASLDGGAEPVNVFGALFHALRGCGGSAESQLCAAQSLIFAPSWSSALHHCQTVHRSRLANTTPPANHSVPPTASNIPMSLQGQIPLPSAFTGRW